MESIVFADLWLPILLGSLAVFLASFVTRMVLRYHWSDYKELPDEAGVREAVRTAGVPAGQYVMPHCGGPDKMKDPVWVADYEKGPSGILVIIPPGPMAFGKSLVQWFIFNLAVSAVAAWLATEVLSVGADACTVFTLVSVIGFLAYGGSSVCGPIWKAESWAVWGKELLDAAIYAAAMAGVMVWLWPV